MQIDLIIAMWVATTLTATGILLNANKKLACWPVWLCSNVFWVYFNVYMHLWGPLALNFVFVCMNFYGWKQWRRYKDK